jgi:hypothetical protein
MFFDSRQQELAARCQALQARNAGLRRQLAVDSGVLQTPLALADRVLAGLRWLRLHPQWLLAGAAALLVLRPRRTGRLGRRLWSAWRVWQQVRRWQPRAGLLRAGGSPGNPRWRPP